MKTFPKLFTLLGTLALLAVFTGCESNQQFKENELKQAGFKTLTATTPAQQAHLLKLPQTKITPVKRNGVQYYVFPDAKKNVLYVGQQGQYNLYRSNQQAMENHLANEAEIQSAFVGEDAFLASFSAWDL